MALIGSQRYLVMLQFTQTETRSNCNGTLFHLQEDKAMNDKIAEAGDHLEPPDRTTRRVRADAQRNSDALLQAAMTVTTVMITMGMGLKKRNTASTSIRASRTAMLVMP